VSAELPCPTSSTEHASESCNTTEVAPTSATASQAAAMNEQGSSNRLLLQHTTN
jgi:hypothetical protein